MYPVSDHCDGQRFFNPSGGISKSFRDFLKWRFNGRRKRWPRWVENNGRPAPRARTSENDLVLTFVNHVTFLIQTNGLNFLTDPVYCQRASPSQRIGPKRVRAPGLPFDSLPQIDAVLVSHNHYDHMDVETLRRLEERFQPLFLTPLGNKRTLGGVARVTECDWWQNIEPWPGTKLHTVPAQHWSGRGLYDRNQALWGGFVIETPRKKIYFAGDTGYGPLFKEIHSHFGTVDVALLPIGAYEPRWFMREQHMNPEDAVLAHLDLRPRLSVGTHFGTFQLTDEGIDDPLKDLAVALSKHRVENFTTMEFGETRDM
jgi:L-ascorbate metabolism protein UlaG (beta-lactamase superfamily)